MASKNVFLAASCVVFFIYFANVVAGASGLGAFLSDIGGMLTLFFACICFVVAILAHERSAAGTDAPSTDNKP